MPGGHVDIGDTRLWVETRGDGPLGLIVLHGGPGLDHTLFSDHLDSLGDVATLHLVDERAQGRSDPAPQETWTLEQHARDVQALSDVLGHERTVVLGHSFGAFIALQHAVDFSGRPAGTIISAGLPSERWLELVDEQLATFEPEDLRDQVAASWAAEATAETQEEERRLLSDQLPFHFADPRDPRIEAMRAELGRMVFSPAVTRAAATSGYGAIELEDRLGEITQPLLVLAGRHDRTCALAGNEVIAAGVPGARLRVFEHSAHMAFVEEREAYLAEVRSFLFDVAGWAGARAAQVERSGCAPQRVNHGS